MKGTVQTQWGKLTDDDLSVARGSRDHFFGRVKERYGVAKEEAERQVDAFMGLSGGALYRQIATPLLLGALVCAEDVG